MKDECFELIPNLSNSIEEKYEASQLKSYVKSQGNNIAPAVRRFGIMNYENRKYSITSLGLRLKEHPEQWSDAVRNQIFLHISDDGVTQPYRLILELLSEFETLSYIVPHGQMLLKCELVSFRKIR